ncbi:uncharacterized protein PV07_04365 [Cladophialophora immunda]|uniref:Uncharacterized protein n=1 Tax=Cladophialophora immunda TaxID=569365 RepID=A0A0D2DAV7_9EURO|nr:uncharacterized protein PV07_04365 [Cladophialophora immunda]KIW32849.1 hypothetical protein PV07_04365 [Cladophialophora immunda]
MEGDDHSGHFLGEDQGYGDYYHPGDQVQHDFDQAQYDFGQAQHEFDQGEGLGYGDSVPEGEMEQEGESGMEDLGAKLQELEAKLDKLEKRYEKTYWSEEPDEIQQPKLHHHSLDMADVCFQILSIDPENQRAAELHRDHSASIFGEFRGREGDDDESQYKPRMHEHIFGVPRLEDMDSDSDDESESGDYDEDFDNEDNPEYSGGEGGDQYGQEDYGAGEDEDSSGEHGHGGYDDYGNQDYDPEQSWDDDYGGQDGEHWQGGDDYVGGEEQYGDNWQGGGEEHKAEDGKTEGMTTIVTTKGEDGMMGLIMTMVTTMVTTTAESCMMAEMTATRPELMEDLGMDIVDRRSRVTLEQKSSSLEFVPQYL